MSAQEKLKASKTPSELTRLKEKWRTLAEPVRDYWREQFISSRSQADIRRELASKLQINLKRDGQLNDFRDWLADQDKRDAQAERNLENERRMIEAHPDWSMDQVREEMLKQSFFEAMATGDFELGLATASAQSQGVWKERQVTLAEQKFAELKKSEQQKALEMCLEEAKEFPDVQEKFKEAFAALKKAKSK